MPAPAVGMATGVLLVILALQSNEGLLPDQYHNAPVAPVQRRPPGRSGGCRTRAGAGQCQRRLLGLARVCLVGWV